MALMAALAGRRQAPGVWLMLCLTVALALLVAAPLLRIALATVESQGLAVWGQVLTGPVSNSLFWRPLGMTLALGLGCAVLATILGGVLAFLVVLTDLPCRRLIGVLSALPFMIPSFAAAFAWGVVFRNERIGGQVGLLVELGVGVPDWLAWGFLPTLIVLTAHYFSLSFVLIASALATVSADLIEAAQMTGARLVRIVSGITLPVVLPALIASFSLTFAGASSNFAAPAILGLPVGMHTLSTRLFGMISTGQVERGYALALLLIAVAAIALYGANALARRRSFATITGKGGRRKRFALARAGMPLAAAALLLLFGATVAPATALLASSLTEQTGALSGGLTLHFWIGSSDPAIAQGQAGILRNPQVLTAAAMTFFLGLCVSVGATVLGLAVSYALVRGPDGSLKALLSQLSFLPLLIPGISFGAAYIALFGRPWGPLPALYGTFTLLVLAGIVYLLPFAVQSGRAVIAQIAADIDDSARLAGSGLLRRLWDIFVPLAIRGLVAGSVLVFVKIVRDLSLVVLLFTPITPTLSVVAFRYASEGFLQFANAITVVITLVALAATALANRLQGRMQPWMEGR